MSVNVVNNNTPSVPTEGETTPSSVPPGGSGGGGGDSVSSSSSSSSTFTISASQPTLDPNYRVNLNDYARALGESQNASAQTLYNFERTSLKQNQIFYRALVDRSSTLNSSSTSSFTVYSNWSNLVTLQNQQIAEINGYIDFYTNGDNTTPVDGKFYNTSQLTDQYWTDTLRNAIDQYNIDNNAVVLISVINQYNTYFNSGGPFQYSANDRITIYDNAATLYNQQVDQNNITIAQLNAQLASLGSSYTIPLQTYVSIVPTVAPVPTFPLPPAYPVPDPRPTVPAVPAASPPPPYNVVFPGPSPTNNDSVDEALAMMSADAANLKNVDRHIVYKHFYLRSKVIHNPDEYIAEKPSPRSGGSANFGTGLGSTLTGLNSVALDGQVSLSILTAALSEYGRDVPTGERDQFQINFAKISLDLQQNIALLSAVTVHKSYSSLLEHLRPGSDTAALLLANEVARNAADVVKSGAIAAIAANLVDTLPPPPPQDGAPPVDIKAFKDTVAAILTKNLQLFALQGIAQALQAPGLVGQVLAQSYPEALPLLVPSQEGELIKEELANPIAYHELEHALVEAVAQQVPKPIHELIPLVQSALARVAAKGDFTTKAEFVQAVIAELQQGSKGIPPQVALPLGTVTPLLDVKGIQGPKTLEGVDPTALALAAGQLPAPQGAAAVDVTTVLQQVPSPILTQGTVEELPARLIPVLLSQGLTPSQAVAVTLRAQVAASRLPQPPLSLSPVPFQQEQAPRQPIVSVRGEPPPLASAVGVEAEKPKLPPVSPEPPTVPPEALAVGKALPPQAFRPTIPIEAGEPPPPPQPAVALPAQPLEPAAPYPVVDAGALLPFIRFPGIDLEASIAKLQPQELVRSLPSVVVGSSLAGKGVLPFLAVAVEEVLQKTPLTTAIALEAPLFAALVAAGLTSSDALILSVRTAARAAQLAAPPPASIEEPQPGLLRQPQVPPAEPITVEPAKFISAESQQVAIEEPVEPRLAPFFLPPLPEPVLPTQEILKQVSPAALPVIKAIVFRESPPSEGAVPLKLAPEQVQGISISFAVAVNNALPLPKLRSSQLDAVIPVKTLPVEELVAQIAPEPQNQSIFRSVIQEALAGNETTNIRTLRDTVLEGLTQSGIPLSTSISYSNELAYSLVSQNALQDQLRGSFLDTEAFQLSLTQSLVQEGAFAPSEAPEVAKSILAQLIAESYVVRSLGDLQRHITEILVNSFRVNAEIAKEAAKVTPRDLKNAADLLTEIGVSRRLSEGRLAAALHDLVTQRLPSGVLTSQQANDIANDTINLVTGHAPLTPWEKYLLIHQLILPNTKTEAELQNPSSLLSINRDALRYLRMQQNDELSYAVAAGFSTSQRLTYDGFAIYNALYDPANLLFHSKWTSIQQAGRDQPSFQKSLDIYV